MDKIKEFFAGKKVYILMAAGSIVAILQYLAGIDLEMNTLPPADNLGELVSQLYAFATVSGFRAALSKKL